MKKKYVLLFVLPYLLSFIGAVCNQVAIKSNGGHMPVKFPGDDCSLLGKHDPVHSCMTEASKFKSLSDIFISDEGVSSVGDYLLDLGSEIKLPSLLVLVAAMIKDRRHNV